MHVIRTWVLIADGAKARILENSGREHAWTSIDGMVFANGHGASHDLVSDLQHAAGGAAVAARSTHEPHSDPYGDHKTRFAHKLSGVLADGLERDAYQRLIIAASPAMLGSLRATISDKVRVRIVGEIARDLTKIPTAELAEHLKPILIG